MLLRSSIEPSDMLPLASLPSPGLGRAGERTLFVSIQILAPVSIPRRGSAAVGTSPFDGRPMQRCRLLDCASSKGGLSIAQSPRACPNLSCSSLDSIERVLCLVRVMSTPDRSTEQTALEPRKRPPNVALTGHLGASLPLAPARFPDSSKSRPHKRSHRWLAASIQGGKGRIPGDRRWGDQPHSGDPRRSVALDPPNGAGFPFWSHEIAQAVELSTIKVPSVGWLARLTGECDDDDPRRGPAR